MKVKIYFVLPIVWIALLSCATKEDSRLTAYLTLSGIYGQENDTIHWSHPPFNQTPAMFTFFLKNGTSDTCKLRFYQSFDSMNYDLIRKNRHAYLILKRDTFELLRRTSDIVFVVEPYDNTGFSLGINVLEIKSKYESSMYRDYRQFMLDIVNNGEVFIITYESNDTIHVDNRKFRRPIIYSEE